MTELSTDTLGEAAGFIFDVVDSVIQHWSLTVHGIEPDLHTPMSFLCSTMAHPDGFVYIVVKQGSQDST
jgi:Autophagy protein ATG5, UblB domain